MRACPDWAAASAFAGRFARLPPGERWHTAHALVASLFVEAGLRFASLATLARMLGIEHAAAAADSAPTAATLSPDVARVVRSVDRVLRRWPGRGRCIRRALVLGHLLRDKNPTLVIGVSTRPTALRAHAWIEVAGASVAEPADLHETFVPLGRA